MCKKISILAAILTIFLALPVSGWAEPVMMEHSYQGYTTDGESFVLDFNLRIQNPTEVALYSLILKTAPLNWLMMNLATVTVGDLAAWGEVSITVTLTTEWLPSDRELQEMPLFWEAKAEDATGQLIWSLAESHPTLEGGLQ